METESISKPITIELHKIWEELNFIKKHMVDVDTILTKEEEILLEKAREEFRAGTTMPLEQLEKELELNV
jgi:hypothetical protein